MKAKRLMTVRVTCVDPDTPMTFAWELMRELKVRHLPVLDGGRLVGIISDRDLLLRAQRNLSGTLEFPRLCAAEVMTHHPIVCTPTATISEVASLMVEHCIDSIPVVGLNGELRGLITSTDVMGLLIDPDQASQVLPFTFSLQRRQFVDSARGAFRSGA